MSWQTVLQAIVDPGLLPPGAQSYLRGQVIQQGVSQGASANAIQSYLAGAGLGMRRSIVQSAVRAERTRQAGAVTSNQVPFDLRAGSALPGEAPAGWTGKYVHQVTATFRTKDEDGNFLLHTRTLGIKSGGVLTPAQAAEAALGILDTPPGEGEDPYLGEGAEVLTATLSGIWYDVQDRGLPEVRP